jgi:glycolate oxidase FAD binding subunit
MDYRPGSEQEVAEIVRDAAVRSAGLAVRGGGTRAPEVAGDRPTLSTAGLTGISLYEPGALTLVVRAGTSLEEVEAALAAEGQQLPFEPWDARPLSGRNGTPTIGGVVATNASGPRRVAAGACRDLMLGVRFVDGTGAVVKNGGRVMKKVTGLDLVKLMAGSHGTLGVLTEVAFKVLPRPETAATLVLDGLDAATAGRAMRAALATPCDVSGAAHVAGRTLLRLEGFEASVRSEELPAHRLSPSPRWNPGRAHACRPAVPPRTTCPGTPGAWRTRGTPW